MSVLPDTPDGVVLLSAVRCRDGWAARLVSPAWRVLPVWFVPLDEDDPLLAVAVYRVVVSEPVLPLVPVDEDEL